MSVAPATEIEEGCASRLAMYRLLEDALEFPSAEFHQSVVSGEFRDRARDALRDLPFTIHAAGSASSALVTDELYVDFQAEYIRLFEVGVVRPPCPLYGGEWGSSRRSIMEDALRFYQFFGMKIDDRAHELPDHVTIELEFMQVMAYTEGVARARGADSLPLVRAQRDFLSRHLGKWWPRLRHKIVGQHPSPFYDGLTDITDMFIAADLAQLRAAGSDA